MKYQLLAPFMLVAGLAVAPVFAADIPTDTKKQTAWGLYVNAVEAAEMKQKLGSKMLFIDVRDPVEIMFTGYTDAIDVNIPFKFINRNQWHETKPVYQLQTNTGFEKEIAAALETRGLTKDDPVVLMCRSGGTRGAPATRLLEGKGYKQVYVVTDGFEGGKIKQGEQKNWRLKNGWKNAGLPWGYQLNKDKMYLPSATASDSKSAFTEKMEHVNPLPNYMQTVMQHIEELELSDEQKSHLQDWMDRNNKLSMDTVNRIVEREKQLQSASLKGAGEETLTTMVDEVSSLRKQLAERKIQCQQNMRSILNKDQWEKLVTLEASKHPSS